MRRTFPLVIRALRVDSRDVKSHLFRGALAAIVLTTLISVQLQSTRLSAPGVTLFWWVTQYNYWFITFAAATFFATAITEEKEERTLSLLKLAGVNAGAMMLGKWLPRLIGAGLLLAIQYPFTVLAIALGGVMWDQVSCAYLCLAAHLWLVGNLGLLASVICARSGSAVGLTVLVLFLYHVVPWAIRDALSRPPVAPVPAWVDWVRSTVDYIMMANGRWQLLEIVATGFTPSFGLYLQIGSNFAAGGLMFLAGWLLFDFCTRNEVEPKEGIWMRRFRFSRISATSRVWPMPLVWKDFHFIAGGTILVALRLTIYAGFIMFMLLTLNDWTLSGLHHDEVGATIMVCSLVVLWIEGSVMATRIFRTEMTGNTWASLCMLPRGLPEVAYNKLIGGLMGLIPGIACFVVGAIIAPTPLGRFLADVFSDRDGPFIVYILILQPLLALHVAAWVSVAVRWANWAAAIFLGGVIVFVCNFLFISCMMQFARGPREVYPLLVLMDLGTVGLLAVMHVLIGLRLDAARAE